jgi:cephalosporin-C deacetylase-like acetyl esterase
MKAVALLLAGLGGIVGSPLEKTDPLTRQDDLSEAMVAGIDRFALSAIERAAETRARVIAAPAEQRREKLMGILGAVDPRVPPTDFELIGSLAVSPLLSESSVGRILRVRWKVFEGVHGEGVLFQPKSTARARVVYLPDCDVEPESALEEALTTFADCEILVPALLNRQSEFSRSERLGLRTNQPHREWIYRQAFELGRHVIGYEVQKALAAVDIFSARPSPLPVVAAGTGEGGLIAFYAGALDERIRAVSVAGYFAPRERVWREPIYRNLHGLLGAFGDAEIAALIAPRPLLVRHGDYPKVDGPPPVLPGQRAIAAPGTLEVPAFSEVQREVDRAARLIPGGWIRLLGANEGAREARQFLLEGAGANPDPRPGGSGLPAALPVDEGRQRRQVAELESFTQKLLWECEAERNATFWKPLPTGKPEAFEASTAQERNRFWNETIGRLPDPDVPARPRTRLISETDKVLVYEVLLDVWNGVFAWGWLGLPKRLDAGEKRPVVVCQHGLEGVPEDAFNPDPSSKAYGYYKAFALRLAEEGFVTYAPHNPYRGKDAFRTLQRKLNPVGKTLFSVIIGQHQRTLEWLKSQPFVDPTRIGFYGLSYGGKSAMRIPAVLPDYSLSICSGDFNEWVRKCASTDLPMSYVYAPEHEIWEWNMGRTFNYAEMAALIAPRPFMVERGHNDGVGLDEWVDYEYAKVRRLYAKLGLPERTTIEHFNGPHTINGEGTLEFLRKNLKPR